MSRVGNRTCWRGLTAPVPLVSFEYHRADPPAARACLDRLAELGADRVALSAAEPFGWLTEWIPVETFRRDLGALLSAPGRGEWGDVFVRTDAADGGRA